MKKWNMIENGNVVNTVIGTEEYIKKHCESCEYAGEVEELGNLGTKITVRSFLVRLGEFRVGIKEAAESDPYVDDFMFLMSQSTAIDLKEQSVEDGLNYLVSVNLLTEEKRDLVLYSPVKKEETP